VIDPLPLEALPPLPPLRLAVVGHVEVVSFVGVEHLPAAGEILHATRFAELPAGGGPVVALQMAKLTGERVPFFTALGSDPLGEWAAAELEALGLEVHVAWREGPTRRGVTFLDGSGERTITVIGPRLTPTAADPLPWEQLAQCDGVFLTAADAGALRRARRASVLAATPRLGLDVLAAAGVRLDALIGSGSDPGEAWQEQDLPSPPALAIRTAGVRGGVATPGGAFAALPRQGPVADTYGAGDCFAAGVTTALAAGWSLEQALSLGCHCGVACVGGQGPYEGQLRLSRRETDGASYSTGT
jgi:ribokinase